MKMTKKTSSIITFLLLAMTFRGYSMESQPPKWAAIVGDVLLGSVTIQMLQLSEPNKPSLLKDLPKNSQEQIIHLLNLNISAPSLEIATATINSLAHMYHELNELINDPQFCFKLIKHLAQKFNCSDQEAAETLQTQEAQRRLELQNQLYQLCNTPLNKISTKKSITTFNSLLEQGVDVNFTYNTLMSKVFYTPLIIALGTSNKIIIKLLLKSGADPEGAIFNKLTPLAVAQQNGNKKIIALIRKAIYKKHRPAKAA